MQSSNRKEILSSVFIVFAAVFAVLIIAWTTGPFHYHFKGTRLVGLYSYFQLFATAYIAYLACRYLEKEKSLQWRQNPSARPFFICALGFLFLGFDDLLSLHENIDRLIHLISGIKETPLTDHLDDFILLLYGIIALFFIREFAREFIKHPYMVGLIVCGVAAFFAMSCLDFLSNNDETFSYFFRGLSYSDMRHTKDIFGMIEESVELVGETFFLSAFIAALVNIKTRNR